MPRCGAPSSGSTTFARRACAAAEDRLTDVLLPSGGTVTRGRPGALLREVSPARAYQDFAVGSRSWPRLLWHELAGVWGAAIPGAAGLAVRRILWPTLFASCGRGATFGRDIALRHPGKMILGASILIDDECLLDAGGTEPLAFRIGDGVLISRSCRIVCQRGSLQLGERVNIGAGCSLFVDGGLRIGADTMLAGHCYIGGGQYDVDQPIDVPLCKRVVDDLPPTVIEEDCWIGAGAIVLSGVAIGRGCVIGAGAVVTRDVPPYSVALGAPARVRRRRRHAPELASVSPDRGAR
jgi:acetyltransferase-like isoleucine patch superfamily enzyme